VLALILVFAASASRIPHSGGSCHPFARRHVPTALSRAQCSDCNSPLAVHRSLSCLLHFLAVGTPSLLFRDSARDPDGLSIRVHGVFNSICGTTKTTGVCASKPLAH